MKLTNLLNDIKTIYNQPELVSIDKYVARMNICKQCPEFKFGFSCSKCGCIMSIKSRWASMNCPENKWSNPPTK